MYEGENSALWDKNVCLKSPDCEYGSLPKLLPLQHYTGLLSM